MSTAVAPQIPCLRGFAPKRHLSQAAQNGATMSKKDLIDAMASHADITKEKAGAALDAIVSHIESTLQSGEEVNFAPLGKFKVTKREAREGRNPSSGEKINIPASNVPKFSPSKTLKDALNPEPKGKKKK
ncbi:MAG: HU family DNA-binding protein [Pseudomonadota bacterium]